MDRRLPGGIHLIAGLDHIAHDHGLDLSVIDLRPCERCPYHRMLSGRCMQI
jgi:hypothetical protein